MADIPHTTLTGQMTNTTIVDSPESAELWSILTPMSVLGFHPLCHRSWCSPVSPEDTRVIQLWWV